MASWVLPQPALPQTNEVRPRGNPPPVISSKPAMPDGHLASARGALLTRFPGRLVAMGRSSIIFARYPLQRAKSYVMRFEFRRQAI